MKNLHLFIINLFNKALLICAILFCLLCSTEAQAQTIDFSNQSSYPSGFPTGVGDSGKDKTYTFTSTSGEKVILKLSYSWKADTDDHLWMQKKANGTDTKYGSIKFTTTSVVKQVVIKTASGQSSSGNIGLYGGTTKIESISAAESKTYTIDVPEKYQKTGSILEIRSEGTAQLRIKEISFLSDESTTIAPPTFSPEAGTYAEGQKVTLSAASSCIIYYTTDGTTPTYSTTETNGTEYKEPITLAVGTTMVKAIAVNSSGKVSKESSAEYVIENVTGKQTPSFGFDGNAEYKIEWGSVSGFISPTLKNGSDATPMFSSENESVVTVDDLGNVTIVGIGQAKITATVDETDNYFSAEASYNLNVVDYIPIYQLVTDASMLADGDILVLTTGTEGDIKVAESWKEGRNNITPLDYTVADDGLIYDLPNGAAQLVLTKKNNYWMLKDGEYYWAATGQSSGKNYLTGTTSTAAVSQATITIDDATYAATIKFNTTNSNTVYLYVNNAGYNFISCYSTEHNPVYLYRQVERVKIGSHGVSSFSSKRYLDFTSTDIDAYSATNANAGCVTLSPISGVVPASTGVMLKGEAGHESLIPVVATAEKLTGNNLLHPIYSLETIEASTDSKFRYLFGTLNGETAFFMLEVDYTSNANRCYLQTDNDVRPNSSKAKGIAVYFEDNTVSSVHSIATTSSPNSIFTLSGQQINSITRPGIYIVGGRKVVVK